MYRCGRMNSALRNGHEKPQVAVVIVPPAGIAQARLAQNALGGQILRMRQTHNAIKTQNVESVVDECPRTLGRKAVPPHARHEAVSDLDLDRRGDVLQAEPADEGSARASFGGPHAKSWIIAVVFPRARDRGGGGRTRADRPVADVSYHARIAVQAMEILRVARMELAQREPLRREQRLAGGTRRHSARLP